MYQNLLSMNIPTCNILLDCADCPRMQENVMTHYYMKKGFHMAPFRCEQNIMIFVLEGSLLVNSKEYAGVTIKKKQFILQGIGSKLEILALSEVDCIFYRFNKPVIVCEDKYQDAIQNAVLPLIYAPLHIISPLYHYLQGIIMLLDDRLLCGELIDIKEKELNILLSCYYSLRDLATLYHSISTYTTNFHYFVMQNCLKTKTVEELAHLGGYTITTFRRIFKNMFNEPAYEWMLKRRCEAILDDLTEDKLPIADIYKKYGFDSFSHFSNFCRTNLGSSPRILRKGLEKEDEDDNDE